MHPDEDKYPHEDLFGVIQPAAQTHQERHLIHLRETARHHEHAAQNYAAAAGQHTVAASAHRELANHHLTEHSKQKEREANRKIEELRYKG